MKRLGAADRLRRMLELVPWVMSQGGAELSEVASRFDYPEEELREDLVKVLFVVGLHPFTPDQLIEVMGLDEYGDENWVNIANAEYFSRPLKLTPDQALGLIGASQALLAGTESDGPLARGLAKLAEALEVDLAHDMWVDVGDITSDCAETLRGAITDRRRVRIRYFTFEKGEESVRVIRPYRLFSELGNLYVRGYCQKAEEPRMFKLDRIRSLEVLGETFDPPEEEQVSSAYVFDDADPRVVVRLDPEAAWVVERYTPEQQLTLDSGEIEATWPVGQTRWLDQLLLQLGPQAKLVKADKPIRLTQTQLAAKRVLARYR